MSTSQNSVLVPYYTKEICIKKINNHFFSGKADVIFIFK